MVIMFISIIIILLLWLLAGYIVFSISIKSKSDKSIVFGDHDKPEKTTPTYSWIDDVSEKYLTMPDGRRLHGYEYLVEYGERFCVLMHGYGGQSTNMVNYMDRFIGLGYSVLSVDLRGHGENKSKYYGLGYLDKEDVAVWINYIKEHYICREVILFGVSMGGSTAILTGALTIDGVSAVISDSSPTDFVSMFSRLLSWRKGKTLGKLVIKSVELFVTMFAGYSLSDVSAIKSVEDITVPVLFIHGRDDGFVPLEMMEALYSKCKATKRKLIVDGANHALSSFTDPTLYWGTVNDFLSKTCLL